MVLSLEESAGLAEIQRLRDEYLRKGKGSELVRKFVSDADNELIVQFLRGRKMRPQQAWDTLKKNAEVRFDNYPDFFPETFPEHVQSARDGQLFGVLKGRNSTGQRILVFNASAWDPDKLTLEDISMAFVPVIDRLIKDEDCMMNGLFCLIQAAGLGFKHAKHYSISVCRRLISIFMYAYPIQYKGIHYLNVPYLMRCVLTILRTLLPKKLSERFFVSSVDQRLEDLHNRISPEILPTFLGGTLEFCDAIDPEFA